MSGTIELKTNRLLLRRHRNDDAEILFEKFGSDPAMFEYSGWNPYQTLEMAGNTISDFIDNYDDPRFYSWAIDCQNVLIGTIGAYDYDADINQIEVGMSIARALWRKGFATEALTAVIQYLTNQEHIHTITAWCASDNIGSRKAMEKAGMKLRSSEAGALEIAGERFDKLVFEYSMKQ